MARKLDHILRLTPSPLGNSFLCQPTGAMACGDGSAGTHTARIQDELADALRGLVQARNSR